MTMNIEKWAKITSIMLCVFGFSIATQAQAACNGSTQVNTPDSDFTVNNDGTVSDSITGLMWKVCSEGQTWNNSDGSCTGTASTHNWQAALHIPQTLNAGGGFAGETDWRLPNVKELKSIVELKCSAPAINATIFNSTAVGYYRSSSPSAVNSDGAWVVYFGNGYDNDVYRGVSYHVRLVRSGQ